MVWYYEKQTEDENIMIYHYSFETKNDPDPGQIMYNKKTGNITVLKIAGSDSELWADWAATHFVKVVQDGFPEKRLVMIG